MSETNDRLDFRHDHTFGQDAKQDGESRTLIVIAITATMMVVEIGAGYLFGSMALLADGLHMASHAAALTITAFAYVFARKHARDEAFSFGTGKVNALGGFSGAILLVVFALLMVGESVHRLIAPVPIAFNQAIGVAVLGLIVNGISVFVLGHDGHHHHHHGHDHGHDHHHGHDHNLQAAYLHVLADALTSVLAIVALLAAKYYDWIWMDPIMGIVGAILITKWSLGLLATTSAVLLDKQGPERLRNKIVATVEEGPGNHRVDDLHLWSIGTGIYSLAVIIVTDSPKSANFRARLAELEEVVHCTVEVHAADPEVS